VGEHAATTATTATAHVVPAAEEIAAAPVSAERAAASVALLVMAAPVAVETEIEVTIVVALMHGVEEIVQTHGKILYR
jgi:hypothetical protein